MRGLLSKGPISPKWAVRDAACSKSTDWGKIVLAGCRTALAFSRGFSQEPAAFSACASADDRGNVAAPIMPRKARLLDADAPPAPRSKGSRLHGRGASLMMTKCTFLLN